MKKLTVIILLLLTCFLLWGVTEETESLRSFLYGTAPGCSYDNWVSHIAEGIARANYNLYSPWEEQTDGFGAYYIPDDIELEQWGAVYGEFISGELAAAEALIDSFGFPYEVVEFTDTESSRTFYMLREEVDYQYYDDNGTLEEYDDEVGAFNRGWGLYLYNPQAHYPIIISAPHPNDDFITPAIALDCLLEWDAMFLFMSGAGREVEWTETGYYNNGKSLSDPTRNDDHPQIVALRLATDLIRESFRREFSAQIHSYDWNRHVGYPNCQVSVVQRNPNLPVRDMSPLHNDMINMGSELMIAAGEYGEHSDCYLNDYYSVYYTQYPFYFYGIEDTIAVNNSVDLTGVGGAFLDFATEDWNSYDVYDPFFHVEMDELPNEYEQNTDNYWNFYGYDSETELWDAAARYETARGWYNHWLSNLSAVLPAVLELDDGLPAAAVEDIWANELTESSMLVHWQPQPLFDFYTYRVYYDEQAIDPETSPYIDRSAESVLASPLADELELHDLLINTEYHIMIATIDYNDNTSWSEEYLVRTAPAVIEDFAGIGLDNYSQLYWTAQQQSGNSGFNVYRQTLPYGQWELHAGWETDPDLISDNSNGQEYAYTDLAVEPAGSYNYRISAENDQGVEFAFDEEIEVSVSELYEVTFTHGATSDSIYISWNEYATDGYDEYFDLISGPYAGQEMYSRIYQEDWTQHWLSRDVRDYYQPGSGYKSWNIRVLTTYEAGEVIVIQFDESYPDYLPVHLQNNYTGELIDLAQQRQIEWVLNENGYADMTLFAGHIEPSIEIIAEPNRIYQANQEVITLCEITFPQLIDSYSLLIANNYSQTVIIDNATTLQQEITWIVPDNITMHSAQQRIYYTDNQGILRYAASEQTCGIVPWELTIELSSGWHNTANWWHESAIAVEDIFGDNAQMYSWEDSSYQSADNFSSGSGYLLSTAEPVQYTASAEITGGALSLPLISGWNLLPNPYPAPLEKQSLGFDYLGWSFTFRQMATMGVISPEVFCYRDSMYIPIETINAGESFYIYNLRDSTIDISAEYTPYKDFTPLPEVVPDWVLSLQINDNEEYSQVMIGSVGNSSDDFDSFHDLAALPAKPQEEGCEIYLNVMDPGYPVSRFQTLYCEPFTGFAEKAFPFSIRGDSDIELLLNADLSQMGIDYFCWLEIDEQIYDLDIDTVFELNTDDEEMLTGTAYIQYPRIWHYGDIDKIDGIAALDAAITLQYNVGIDPVPFAPLPWQDWQIITADVDGNGEVGSYDAALILQYCIDMIDSFPVENLREEYRPEGSVELVAAANELKLIAGKDVYSVDIMLPQIVKEVEILNGSAIWAENSDNGYHLALASAEMLEMGKPAAILQLSRGICVEEIELKVNSQSQQVVLTQDEAAFVTCVYPIYPNPLLGETLRDNAATISFYLAETAEVKTAVYNIKGQKVKSLMTKEYPQGYHQLSWMGDNNNNKPAGSGIYFISVEINGKRQIRKIMVIK